MVPNTRVRFAPSPTGFLHVGGLRTALFNFLFAKKNKGVFILRIEDTDKSREVAGAVENIQITLKTFKLDWDEGPIFQSGRLEIYKKHADELIAKGAAYKCFCTEPRIEELRKKCAEEMRPFRYDKHCLKNPGSGDKFVIRQNVTEEGFTEFDDLVYGLIKIENRLLDDGVLMKSDGFPVYNFANVVDDHMMDITHVIRGEEFISSTPKHVLLYKAFGWNLPKFVHLPLLLDKQRKKLSKRTGDVAVKDYLDKKYLPEAIINYIALLGWNPKTTQEIFSLQELIQAFDINKINKAGAVFDITKLDYLNREWERRSEKLSVLISPEIQEARLGLYHYASELESKRLKEGFNKELFQIIWPQIHQRIKGPSDLESKLPEFDFYFINPEPDPELLFWKDDKSVQNTKTNLQKIKEYLAKAGEDGLRDPEQLEKLIKAWLKDNSLATGNVLWPLRVALSGLRNSPSPFEIISAFSNLPGGKEIIAKRLKAAIEKL